MSPTDTLWHVLGVDRESGEEVRMTFRATAPEVARVMAERKGMHVASVVSADDPASESSAISPRVGKVPAKATAGEIICPNPRCGYVGPPTKKARGSTFIGLVLCLIMLVPGILYFIILRGYKYSCPRCGLEVRSDF